METYINDSIYKFGDAEALVHLVLSTVRREHLIKLEIPLPCRYVALSTASLSCLKIGWVNSTKKKEGGVSKLWRLAAGASLLFNLLNGVIVLNCLNACRGVALVCLTV